MVKIAGLLPARPKERKDEKAKLAQLVQGKHVEIAQYLYVADTVLTAIVHYNGASLQSHFPHREIPTLEPTRWHDPEESRLLARNFGGLPKTWENPINKLKPEESPFWGNLAYPLRPWERDYEVASKLINALYSDSHHNKRELDRWFDIFLRSPQREAALIVEGDVGVGKSWWIGRKLASLPQDKYHVILIDLRYKRRGEDLPTSIEASIGEYLEYYIPDLSWMYPEFKALYGSSFDPDDEKIRSQMIDRALSLPPAELNDKRLRYYSFPNSPELLIAFDNVDHFDESEIIATLDICRRVVGDRSGVRVIVAVRPTTRLPKSRRGLVFGDMIHRQIDLKSPDLYEVLRRRLATNADGRKLDLSRKLPSDNHSLGEILAMFRRSDRTHGLARLLKGLCCTERVPDPTEDTQLRLDPVIGATSFDLRFYLKLFRRLVRSDTLGNFANIDNPYFGIHALLLRADEPMMEGDAFLFNLFDNERPDFRGNALIRYRVLEYCALFHDAGELFDQYFQALGVAPSIARSVLHLFEDAGLVDMDFVELPEGERQEISARISIPGRRHLELVTNLWYLISIKTGVHIYQEYILFGEEALEAAGEFVRSEKILSFYSEHGWIPEDKFVEFLGHQVFLEDRRIGRFQEQHPEWRIQISNMVSHRSDPAANLYWSINEQLANWKSARRR